MTIHSIILRLVIFILLITSFGCQQKNINQELDSSSSMEAVKTSAAKPPAVLYRSIDLGKTWSRFANGIPADATLSGIKQDGNKIYVTTDDHGVFISKDGLDNWMSLNSEALKGMDINCIEVDANNLVIGTLNQGVFISKDGGVSWSPSKENIKSQIRAFIKSGEALYAGTDAGIFVSVDMGNIWKPIFGKMQILGFTSLNEKIYAATQHGAVMLDEDPSSWKSIYKGDALHDIGNDGKYIYAMTIGQQLLKTQNDGVRWENAQNGITYPANFYTNELQYIGNDIFSAQWIGIYHSQNNGESWKKLTGLPDATAFSTLEVTDYGIIAGISIR